MPNKNTFSIKPIKEFVKSYLEVSLVSIDPFARDCEWFTYSNDLNPDTKAKYHLDAIDFLKLINEQEIKADLLVFDPPYSVRAVAECYKGIGRTVTQEDTQSSFYSNIKNEIMKIVKKNGYVLSFGWNSGGIGKTRGFEIIEIMLVSHGGCHNDTICVAERKVI